MMTTATSRKTGLLYQGSDLWRDPASRQSLLVQLAVLFVVLVVSAIYHFLFSPSSQRKPKEGVLDERIARVHRLFVYPIKSCAGVELSEAKLSAKGFEFDRRWLVVRLSRGEGERQRLDKLSLREEPRLTLVRPSLSEEEGCMRLSISAHAKQGKDLPPIEVPLRPTQETLQEWPRVPTIEMYGDQADGREVQLLHPAKSQWKGSPSEWISKFLGYDVLLLQFDPYTSIKRQNFPVFKPPHDLSSWERAKREELERLRPIEFQDEYPLLVATQESLDAINSQISRAISDPSTDGHEGPPIRMFDASRYAHLLSSTDKVSSSDKKTALISALRFRPNVLLAALNPESDALEGYSEDSWERFWIEGGKEGERRADVALVARCKRCLLTTVDPVTAEKDASLPLAFLRRSRHRDKSGEGERKMGPCWGCYGVLLPVSAGGGGGDEQTTTRYGEIKVGDEVWVRWRPLEADDEPLRKQRWDKRQKQASSSARAP